MKIPCLYWFCLYWLGEDEIVYLCKWDTSIVSTIRVNLTGKFWTNGEKVVIKLVWYLCWIGYLHSIYFKWRHWLFPDFRDVNSLIVCQVSPCVLCKAFLIVCLCWLHSVVFCITPNNSEHLTQWLLFLRCLVYALNLLFLMWYTEKYARERAFSLVERICWLLPKMYVSIPATSHLD